MIDSPLPHSNEHNSIKITTGFIALSLFTNLQVNPNIVANIQANI